VSAPIHQPSATGFAALDELDRVPWAELDHAYGTGVGDRLHEDVPGSLRKLNEADPHDAFHALYSNICHQGTVYEATAYAVPFLAAVTAGNITTELRIELMLLLASIALAGSYATEDGTRAGAFGEDVDELIQGALVSSSAHLRAIAVAEPSYADTIAAIGAIAEGPSRITYDQLRRYHRELEQAVDDLA
jgi:hypothetical protein